MFLRKVLWFVSIVLCFGLINVSAQDQTPKPKIISAGVINGKANDLPKPVYPAVARAVCAKGAVNVAVTIDESGNVESASAVSGHPLLRAAAVAAARGAKFKPTLFEGNPVKVKGIIVYNFVPSPKVKPTFDVVENDSPDAPKTINGGVLNGKAVSLPKPEYPAEAREQKAEGAVNVSITIDEEGNVVSAKAVSGNPLLYEACEKAALQAKFTPTLLEGIPVAVTGTIIYNFIP